MTKTINQESVDKIVDAILCVGVPYMNEGWAKFPKEHTQMLDGFKATKGYKEAREQIKKLLVEANQSILRELIHEQKEFIKAQSGHIRNRKNPLYGAGVTSKDTLEWLERKLAQLTKST